VGMAMEHAKTRANLTEFSYQQIIVENAVQPTGDPMKFAP
jgi:hypothetical protein